MTPGLIFADYSSGLSGRRLFIDGDFQIEQRILMRDNSDYLFDNDALNFSMINQHVTDALSWEHVVSAYRDYPGT